MVSLVRPRFHGFETFLLTLFSKNPRSRFFVGIQDDTVVSILNLEARYSNSAASLVQSMVVSDDTTRVQLFVLKFW